MKILLLTIVNLIQLAFVIFMFYESEPKYKNDSYGKPAVGDYVDVISGNSSYYLTDNHFNGLVVQTDSVSFSIRFNSVFPDTRTSAILYFPYNCNCYKILGIGTFYHRVNNYIGFNIMLITTLMIVVLFIVTARAETLIIMSMIK